MATGWTIPPNTATDCVLLPIIKGGKVTNLGDIPFQGQAITPTCDPTKLSTATVPNPANTYFNQLGCSISHGVATDAQTRDVLPVRGRHQGRAVQYRAQQRLQPAGRRRRRQDQRAAELLLRHPRGQQADQRRGQPGRNVRNGHLDPPGPGSLGVPQPAGQPGRPEQADQPELLRPAGQLR